MIRDLVASQTNGKKIIEVLIGGEVKVWVPMIAVKAFLINKDGDIERVQAVRVRNIAKEIYEDKNK